MHYRYTAHLRFKMRERKLSQLLIERVVSQSGERYLDVLTGRFVAVQKVMQHYWMAVLYEKNLDELTLITAYRLKRERIDRHVQLRRWVRYEG